jgi:hypothetical protein
MQRARWLVAVGCAGVAGVPLLATSCGGGSSQASVGADASDAMVEAEVLSVSGDAGPMPDANVPHCTLDNGTDPVALCVQKMALEALHSRAFDSKGGVAASWSPSTGRVDVGDGGARVHSWTDDVGYAAAAAAYLTSAAVYGDPQLTTPLDGDLHALATLLKEELSPLPEGYSGEPYLRLRVAAGGLRTVNDVTEGDAIDSVADAYGRAAFTQYYVTLAALPGDAGSEAGSDAAQVADGGPDAAVDARGGDGSAVDATTPGVDAATDVPDATLGATDAGVEAGDAAVIVQDGVFGRPSGSGYAYTTADVATAACAMLDLAARDPSDASAKKWQMAAMSAFDHIHDRARDPVTGLYFTALVTSGDPGHDALQTSLASPGVLLTDTTATVALALARARDLASANTTSLSLAQGYPFTARIADALAALQVPSLYDGPLDAATGSATGFMAGYDPDAGILTSKPTRPNAYLLAVLNRQFTVGTPWGTEIGPLDRTLIGVLPANTSLLTVIPDQAAYFEACTRDFKPLGADAGPYAASYQAAAVVAFVEGMNALLPAQQ